MTVKEISVSVGRTINLGNFESLRVDVSAAATISENDDADLKRSELSNWLRRQVQKTLAEQR